MSQSAVHAVCLSPENPSKELIGRSESHKELSSLEKEVLWEYAKLADKIKRVRTDRSSQGHAHLLVRDRTDGAAVRAHQGKRRITIRYARTATTGGEADGARLDIGEYTQSGRLMAVQIVRLLGSHRFKRPVQLMNASAREQTAGMGHAKMSPSPLCLDCRNRAE